MTPLGISYPDRRVPHFLARVNRTPGQGPRGDCHEWTGARNELGYGIANIAGRTLVTHRIMASLVADIAGVIVAHHCDNPPCCRLSHLFCTDNAGNVADRQAKRRSNGGSRPGQLHPNAKLTEADIWAIRESPDSSKLIAEQYSIDRKQVDNIRTGRSWGHVPMPEPYTAVLLKQSERDALGLICALFLDGLAELEEHYSAAAHRERLDGMKAIARRFGGPTC